MPEKANIEEASYWDLPTVKYRGHTYRVLNSKKFRRVEDIVYYDVASEDYLDALDNLQVDSLRIWDVSKISHIRGLSSLTFIKKLDLRGTIYRPDLGTIKKIECLEKLVNLEKLNLSENQIIEITGLDTLENLKRLYLQGNLIKEIKGLDNLKSLEHLNLSRNQITEIKGLDNLKNLKKLNLSDNEIIEIKEFDNLINLKELNFSNNKITEINGNFLPPNLEILYLEGNDIENTINLDNREFKLYY